MECYNLSLNDLNLIRHLQKSRETFIRFTYNKNIQEKVEVGRLRRAGGDKWYKNKKLVAHFVVLVCILAMK